MTSRRSRATPTSPCGHRSGCARPTGASSCRHSQRRHRRLQRRSPAGRDDRRRDDHQHRAVRDRLVAALLSRGRPRRAEPACVTARHDARPRRHAHRGCHRDTSARHKARRPLRHRRSPAGRHQSRQQRFVCGASSGGPRPRLVMEKSLAAPASACPPRASDMPAGLANSPPPSPTRARCALAATSRSPTR